MFILQIVMQAKALLGKMFANDRHAEVRAVASPVSFGERIAIMAGRIGAFHGLGKQVLPSFIGQTTAIPIRAGILASMIEKANVVILLFERFDLARDKVIELAQLKMGDVTDFRNFLGAVIDAKSFANLKGAIDFNNNTGFDNEPRIWGITFRKNWGN